MHEVQAIPGTETHERTSRTREGLDVGEIKGCGNTTREPVNRVGREMDIGNSVCISSAGGKRSGVFLRRREGGRGQEA